MSFSDDIRAFNKKVEKNTSRIFRGSFITLTGMIINRTPVLSGRLRNNWMTEINRPSDSANGDGGLSAAIAVAGRVKLGDSLYLVNNLPYAKPIEDGHGGHAPKRMVGVSIASWDRIVEAMARKVNR